LKIDHANIEGKTGNKKEQKYGGTSKYFIIINKNTIKKKFNTKNCINFFFEKNSNLIMQYL